MRNHFFFILLIALLFLGCDSDSDSPLPVDDRPLVELDFFHYLSEGYRGFLIITDLSGNVLYNKEFFGNDLVKPIPETTFDGELVNVFIINQGDPFYHTTAYFSIKRGSTWNMRPQTIDNVNNPIKLNFKNVGTFNYLTFGTNYFSTTVASISDTTGRTSFNWITGGKIYAQVVRGDEARYGFSDIDPAKASFDIDFATLPNVSRKQVITYPEISIGGYNISAAADQNNSYTFLFDRTIYESKTVVHFPDLFENYYQNLSFTKDEKFFYYSKSGRLVTEYDLYAADAQVTNSSPTSFSMQLSGEIDYYSVDFQNYDSREFIHVFAPHYVTEFQIPDFSKIADVPGHSFDKFNLNRISLTDIEGVVQQIDQFNFQFRNVPKGSMMRTVTIPF